MQSAQSASVTVKTHRWWVRAWLFVFTLQMAHMLMRCLFFKNLYFDEAEQLIFIQNLSLGYSPQPPLFSWIVWLAAQIVGVNVLALALVHGLLLLALYVEMHFLVRQLFPDQRSVLAFLAPLLVPLFAWDALRMSHTPLLCVLCLATILLLLRIERQRTWNHYALLGCCFGLGMLTKYNYALFAGACLSACLMLRDFRSVVLTPKLMLSMVLGLLMVLPHACWAYLSADQIAHYYQELQGNAGAFTWLAGLRQAGKILLILLTISAVPITLLVLLGWRSGWLPRQSLTPSCQWLLWVLVWGIGFYLSISLLGKMQNFRHHWLAPFVLLIPLLLLARINPNTLHRPALRFYVAVAIVMSLTILGVRGSALVLDYHQGKYETRDFLFAELEQQLAQQGIAPDQVISCDIYAGGYSRIYLASSSVQCSAVLNVKPERHTDGITLVLWDATESEGCSPKLPRFFQDWFNEQVPMEQAHHIDASPRVFDTHMKRLGYCVLMPRVQHSVMKPAD